LLLKMFHFLKRYDSSDLLYLLAYPSPEKKDQNIDKKEPDLVPKLHLSRKQIPQPKRFVPS